MGKTRDIGELVRDLQRENQSLKGLQSLFNQAVKKEFGYDVKTLHAIIAKQQQYERKMAERKAMQQGQQQANSQSE